MTMTLAEKLKVLVAHYKIDDKTMAPKERMRAVRRASKEDSIDVAYSKLPESVRRAAEKELEKVETKKEADKPKDGEIIPPRAPMPVTVDGATQRVEVAAPTMSFHLAPPSINVGPASVSWSYTLQRSAMYGFVFASGTMFGVLLVLVRLKGVG